MALLKQGDKVALVACSNGQNKQNEGMIAQLISTLNEMGVEAVCSPYLYADEDVFNGTAQEKGEALMSFYKDEDIKAIFDISGGDLANEVLGRLDYEVIKKNNKPFFGYSDLTTVVNGIYAKTGNKGYLYQIRNIIREEAELQQTWVRKTLFEDKKELLDFSYEFVQGDCVEGEVVGGNIRCFLKLAGTPYMPDFTDKVLLLEAMSGGPAQMNTFLNQYAQMGAFEKVRGIILGSFSKMEKEELQPDVVTLLKRILNQSDSKRVRNLPIVKTREIGHGADSKAVVIGEVIKLQNMSR
nr:S66 peptidase family protein [uncultured Cellulosilyticum sp.]